MSMRKKPWNRVNSPVYSVVSRNGQRFNMNICTYVTPISMQPRHYLLGIYEGTQTLANMRKHPELVLQFLSAPQFRLVTLLGKQSGKKIDKINRLQRRNLLTTWQGFPVLNDARALIHLQVIRRFPGGDHHCFICRVVHYENRNEELPLELDQLKSRKIIRS